ncbi:MAG: tandem-95 repeat protein, partial [Fidelibacterota bacterium]
AHMAHPWLEDCCVVVRKHVNVYADVSARFYRPWSFYNGMRYAYEWAVVDKLLFGTDYPVSTPEENFNGSDSLTYTISDGKGGSASADVTITVDPVNDAPIAADQSVSTSEDASVAITLTASDVDEGDVLTFEVISGPANGSLSGSAPELTYTPNPDFNGEDGFTFRVSDGLASDQGTVSISVGAANDPPVAVNDEAATDEDTPVTIDVLANDTDDDGDALSVASVTQGANGSVVINVDGTVTYTPNENFSGSDSFTYTATDGELVSDPAMVTVLVNLAGDLIADEPVDPIEGGTVTTDIGVSIEIPSGSLSEAVNIQIGTYEVLPPDAPPLAGMLFYFGPSGTTFDPPATITVPYDPLLLPEGFNPDDLVLLIYNEGDGTWEEGLNSTVDTDALTITGQTTHFSGFAAGLLLDRAPYCIGLSPVAIDEDAQSSKIIGNLADYFADPNFGDQLKFDVDTLDEGLHALYITQDLSLVAEPILNFFGDVRIVITATDLTGLSVSDTLLLTIISVNDAPVFLATVADAYTINEDQLLRIHLSAEDLEGDDVTFSAASDTSAVTTLIQDTTLLAAPIQNWYGTANIVVSASDGQDVTYLDPFILTVESVNDEPSEFDLLEPDADALFHVETSQLDDYLTFTWKEVTDPDDPVSYTFTLSDTGGTYFTYDTTTSVTEVRIPYAYIVSAITNQDLKMATFEWTVVAIAGSDMVEASNGPNNLTIDINTLAVTSESHLPQFFALHQNYPNPFNPVTTLKYELPAYCQVLLVIYDMRGREVVRLVDGYESAGYNKVVWNSGDAFGRPVPSGVYFARLITSEYTRVIKMTLVR